jgi:UDP-N-acetylmuramate dehydrogenase
VGSVFKNVVISEIENKTARERLLFNYTKDRENKNKPTAGSKKDPPLSIPAGYLVEEAGLKGKRIGGAEVSPEHGNIIVNLGNATAEDVVMLVGIIKTKVRDDLGIQLKEEMTYVG